MPTLELPPVPYPRDEHEARMVLAIFLAAHITMLAWLTVQGIREGDFRLMMALIRYLRWRRQMSKWTKKWNGER